MKRRTFTYASLGAAAIAYACPWREGFAADRASHERVLVLTDSTLPASRAYAAMYMAAGRHRLETGLDVGALWHSRLREWAGTIRGVLRPSDCFVLQNLSVSEGRAFFSMPIDPHRDAVSEGAIGSRHALLASAVVFEIR